MAASCLSLQPAGAAKLAGAAAALLCFALLAEGAELAASNYIVNVGLIVSVSYFISKLG